MNNVVNLAKPRPSNPKATPKAPQVALRIAGRKYVVLQSTGAAHLIKRAGKVGQFHLYDSASKDITPKMEWWECLQAYSDRKDQILGVSESVTVVATTDEEFERLLKGDPEKLQGVRADILIGDEVSE